MKKKIIVLSMICVLSTSMIGCGSIKKDVASEDTEIVEVQDDTKENGEKTEEANDTVDITTTDGIAKQYDDLTKIDKEFYKTSFTFEIAEEIANKSASILVETIGDSARSIQNVKEVDETHTFQVIGAEKIKYNCICNKIGEIISIQEKSTGEILYTK